MCGSRKRPSTARLKGCTCHTCHEGPRQDGSSFAGMNRIKFSGFGTVPSQRPHTSRVRRTPEQVAVYVLAAGAHKPAKPIERPWRGEGQQPHKGWPAEPVHGGCLPHAEEGCFSSSNSRPIRRLLIHNDFFSPNLRSNHL